MVLMVAIAAAAGIARALRTGATPAHQSITSTLPLPVEAPPAKLPQFRYERPRLPAPTAAEKALIRARNPDWLERARRKALVEDDLYGAVASAYFEPPQTPATPVFERLMRQDFGARSNDTFTIAIGYDWLHDRFTAAQRGALQDRLLAGCTATASLIREAKLSPYNVILYNNPLQSLVACSIALYGTSEDADALMNFAADLLDKRVMPVWRQVMGRTGGWHEGGEYVGIGIGQAIYRVPAMWRAATGIDYFESEPGIRGFLDFWVYRKQPDGDDFHWGDAGHFRRDSPDRTALALHFGHKAAYSLGGCPRPNAPSSLPWGPLTRDELCDPAAVRAMSWVKHFDGIGLIVARSGWEPDATYVTFKAGDNYWSHSHLDQGAFTLFKNAPLALDSGLYGIRAGSDHHMNYAYQSIAHNVVTVTDPADTVPLQRGETVRRIANEGGQRRVGSGWGVEPAPLDVDEWRSKRDTYHTGRIMQFIDAGDVLLAVADLTPAYTNSMSGRGTFSHRTRRVKRYIRAFGYDRRNDAVVVFDHIERYDPSHEVRWLLHAENEPEIAGTVFTIRARSAVDTQLTGRVLLPSEPRIETIGGAGFEYFAGGTNYDEGGKVQSLAAQHPDKHAGAWRLEVTPSSAGDPVEFLTVLVPRARDAGHTMPEISVSPAAGGLLICTLRGSGGETRFSVDPAGVRSKVVTRTGGRP
jgi:hypothetical protein